MTIQKLNNTSFGSSTKQNFGENSLYRLSDEQIKSIAISEPSRRLHEVQKNSKYTLLVGVPLVDSLLSGAMTSGSLAKKTTQFLTQQSKWLGVFAVGSALFGAKHFINKKSETLDNFNKKHPVLSTGVDFVALYGALTVAALGTSSLIKAVNKKYPKISDVIERTITSKVGKVLDNTTLNKNFVQKFDAYMAKNNYARKAGAFVALSAAPLMAIAALMRLSKETNFAASRANNNYILLNTFNRFLPEKPVEEENIDI